MSESQRYFDVVLLMSDLKEARELSHVFKRAGINPIIYTEYGPFWHGILNRPPSLAVVDISLMGQGHLPLNEHPLIKGGQLPLAFFYKEEHRPLLVSTLDYAHYGLLKRQGDYESVIKSLLLRVNQHLTLENNLKQKDLELDKRQALIRKFQEQNEELRMQMEAWLELKKFSFDLDTLREVEDFSQWIFSFFEKWDLVNRFAAYEHSISDKKLISPPYSSPKNVSLPTLNIADKKGAGFSPIIQNMAAQLALENLGPKLISLTLHGKFDCPSMIVFLELNDQMEQGLREIISKEEAPQDELFSPPWGIIENLLNGAYAVWELFHFSSHAKGRTLERPLFDLLSLADREFFGEIKSQESLEFTFLGINLSALDTVIKKTPENRFYYQKFGFDFNSRIQNILKTFEGQVYFSQSGPFSFVLAIQKDIEEKAWTQFKDLCERFSYWRYFENPEKIFMENIRASVRQLPQSSDAILNYLSNPETQFTSSTQRKTNLNSAIQHKIRPSTNEIRI